MSYKRDGVEVTKIQKWHDGDTEITIETSDTDRAYGQLMLINGKPTERGWAFHHPPHGPSELFGTDPKTGVTYGYFWPYWDGYVPTDTVVRLQPCTKD